MSRRITSTLFVAIVACGTAGAYAQDRGAQETEAAREQEKAREQAAREQQKAREQAANDTQKAREEAARRDQKRAEEARTQRERLRNGQQGDKPVGQSPETLFRRFKVETSNHRDRTARISALRRIANARQNQDRVADLDRLLARENTRYAEWVRRTRNALGEDEFERQQARIDGRAVGRGEAATRTQQPTRRTQEEGSPRR